MRCTARYPVVNAINFKDFVQHGIDSGANLVNGVPWSFTYLGYPVTHENDSHYLICIPGRTVHFTPNDILYLPEEYGCEPDVMNAELFAELYVSPTTHSSLFKG